MSYFDFNTTGMRSTFLFVVAAQSTSIRCALQRVAVLLVCMGYGVMRPTLSRSQGTVAAATGAAYGLVLTAHSQLPFVSDVCGCLSVCVCVSVVVVVVVVVVVQFGHFLLLATISFF